jgi:YidC/Oxa1 family membrane protein insertase
MNTDLTQTKVLTLALVIIMCATQFTTQRQLMTKNMPADAMSGQYAQQQKMLLYILPVVFAVGGVAFPLGVLFYWTTSNLWTMGQQLFVIRNNPVPGTPAHKAKLERDALKGNTTAVDTKTTEVIEPPKPPQRQQPKKQARSQRKKTGPPQPKKRPDITSKDNTDKDGAA